MVRGGRSTDATPTGVQIRSIRFDLAGISGLNEAIYSNSWQENSGAFDCFVSNYTAQAIDLESSGGKSPENWKIEKFYAFPASGVTASQGIRIAQGGAIGLIDKVTIDAPTSSGGSGPSQTGQAGIDIQNGFVTVIGAHVEGHAYAVRYRNGGSGNVISTEGAPNTTTVVRIESDAGNPISVIGSRRKSATNLVDDHINSVVITADQDYSTGAVTRVTPGSTLFQSGVGSDVVPLIAKGSSGQTSDLFETQKSDGTVVAAIPPAGGLWLQGLPTVIGPNGDWGVDTGTADQAAHATYTAPTYSAPPTQADTQALANEIQVLSQQIKALKDNCEFQGACLVNLVTNGLFVTDLSSWTNGSTGTGTATWTSSGAQFTRVDFSNRGYLYEDIPVVIGGIYKLLSTSSGNFPRLTVSVGGTAQGPGPLTFTATGTSARIGLDQSGPGTAVITNVILVRIG
jgi:hypothetical protein